MKQILICTTLFSLVTILFSKCDLDDHKLVLVNNSKGAIYYLAYPDTIVQIKSVENFSEVPYRKIKSGDSTHPLYARLNEGGFKNKINDSTNKALFMFYFSVDSVNKYGWETILKLRIYERQSFKVRALDSLNWRIIYTDK